MFNIAYHSNGAFNITELYNLPVYLRQFYARKLVEVKNKEAESAKSASKQSPKRISKPPSSVRSRLK